jgi:hypothetical protein
VPFKCNLYRYTPVRAAAARALASVAGGAGKGLGKHLKQLIPAWWCAVHDPSPEAREQRAPGFLFSATYSTLLLTP